MVNRRQAKRVGQLSQLRKAEAAAAATELRASLQEYDKAAAACDQQAELRDQAESTWRQLVQARHPDTGLAQLAGVWLLHHQRELEAEQLNLAIFGNRLALMRGKYSQALAKESAVEKISEKVYFGIAKYLDEVQSWNLIDAALWSWDK